MTAQARIRDGGIPGYLAVARQSLRRCANLAGAEPDDLDREEALENVRFADEWVMDHYHDDPKVWSWLQPVLRDTRQAHVMALASDWPLALLAIERAVLIVSREIRS